MSDAYLAAAIEMESGPDKRANLATATRLVEQAADAGAQLVVLPEFFNCLGSYETVALAAEPIPGLTSDALAALAERLSIMLVTGSIAEASPSDAKTADDERPSPPRVFNTSLIFDDRGRLLARYRKQHRFDIDLQASDAGGGVAVCESQWIAAGDSIATVATPLGTLGPAICYDLRFPELFRRLSARGVEIIALPAAFSAVTGAAHWEVLLRARAIENQCYVIAANQCGHPPGAFAMHGHSMIVDPWGRILAQADDRSSQSGGGKIVCATIDRAALAQIRATLPALKHRRD